MEYTERPSDRVDESKYRLMSDGEIVEHEGVPSYQAAAVDENEAEDRKRVIEMVTGATAVGITGLALALVIRRKRAKT